MTKEEARELFSSAYEGELDDARLTELRGLLAADPELAREYDELCATLALLRQPASTEPTPNLLLGVQQRLRARSRGRFYADRFAERLGLGPGLPLTLALVMLGLLGLAWLGLALLERVRLGQ